MIMIYKVKIEYFIYLFISITILVDRGQWINQRDRMGVGFMFVIIFTQVFLPYFNICFESLVHLNLLFDIITEYIRILCCFYLYVPIFTYIDMFNQSMYSNSKKTKQ